MRLETNEVRRETLDQVSRGAVQNAFMTAQVRIMPRDPGNASPRVDMLFARSLRTAHGFSSAAVIVSTSARTLRSSATLGVQVIYVPLH
jgi:hypothetical protein